MRVHAGQRRRRGGQDILAPGEFVAMSKPCWGGFEQKGGQGQFVVIPGWTLETGGQVDHDEEATGRFEIPVVTTLRSEHFRAAYLEPDRIVGVVSHTHGIAFAVPNPDLHRMGSKAERSIKRGVTTGADSRHLTRYGMRKLKGRRRPPRGPRGLFSDAESAEDQIEHFIRIDVAFQLPDRVQGRLKFVGDDLRRRRSRLTGRAFQEHVDGVEGRHRAFDGRGLASSPPTARQSIAAGFQFFQSSAQLIVELMEPRCWSTRAKADADNAK